MSIEAVFGRIAEALEGIHETLVGERLDRQRGGAGTPGHVNSAGMVDNVIARKLDTKDVQMEMEKLDRPDLIRELKLLGQDPSNKLGDKRLRKMLVEAIMTKKAQDAVYGKPKAEEAQDAGTTEDVAAVPAGSENIAKMASAEPESGEEANKSSTEPAPAAAGPVVAPVHVEEVSMEQVKKTCLAFIQSVHGGDVEKGKVALAGILCKFDPSYSQLKDLAPEHRAAFHEEVLNA